MKELDVKKITHNPENKWEAITAMIETEQRLVAVLSLLQSIKEYPTDMDIHFGRIAEILSLYEKDE